MLGDNLKLLKTLKEDTQENINRVTNLLVKYGDIAYGENVDYNSEEAQDAGVIHDALEHYLTDLNSDLHSINNKIAREEKRIKHIPKRLKELVGKKIKVTSVYDEYFKDVVGKVGTVLDVKRDELNEQWVLEVDIRVVEMWDKCGNSCYPNFRLFVGDDRYRTVKTE